MATVQSVFIPTSPIANVTTFNGTLGALGNVTISIPPRSLFAVTVSADSNIEFGNVVDIPLADATDWPIWAKSVQEWEMGEEFDQINLFSTAGGSYWVYILSRT